MKRFLGCLLAACLLIPLITGIAYAGQDRAGTSVLTLMVYISGSDLETGSSRSSGGAATRDIAEMLRAGADTDKTNIIICTGGARHWNSGIPSDKVCFYQLKGVRPVLLESRDLISMGDPDTLSGFLNYSVERFPADRYALILWDHGAGPMNGVCFDELFSRDAGQDSLDLNEISAALSSSPFGNGNRLEWIGFDACLMSAVETAYVCAPFAKYMIASQETEIGNGWDYSFLKYADAGLSGAETGKLIIDRYFSAEASPDSRLTLSCIDLEKIADVETAMNDLFSSLDSMLSPEAYSSISNGRKGAKGFGRATTGSEYDLVDLYSLAEQYRSVAPEKVRKLQEAVQKAVVCHQSTQNDSYGLSVYYPYYNKQYFVDQWNQFYASLGFAEQYYQFMLHYSDIWLSEALTDWSELREAEVSPLPEGLQISLQLTAEQLACYGYAQLIILSDTSFDEPYYYKIYETDDVSVSETGTLLASYDFSALYLLDENGNPEGPLPYRMTDDTLLVLASLEEMTLDMRVQAIFENPHFDTSSLLNELVYLQCRPHSGTGDLEVVGVIILGDSANQETSDSEGLHMGKQVLTLDTEEVRWVSFHAYPRLLTYGPDGRVLPFSKWYDPLQHNMLVRVDAVADNSREWTLAFRRDLSVDSGLFAQYVIHDTQGNTVASELIPLTVPLP